MTYILLAICLIGALAVFAGWLSARSVLLGVFTAFLVVIVASLAFDLSHLFAASAAR